jgi:hypothetical protein
MDTRFFTDYRSENGDSLYPRDDDLFFYPLAETDNEIKQQFTLGDDPIHGLPPEYTILTNGNILIKKNHTAYICFSKTKVIPLGSNIAYVFGRPVEFGDNLLKIQISSVIVSEQPDDQWITIKKIEDESENWFDLRLLWLVNAIM